MERLTVREKNGFVTLGKRSKGCLCPTNFCNYEKCEKRADRSCSVLMALDRLAAYEDTGLEPEICAEYKKFEDEAVGKNVPFSRIIFLMNAEAKGRLLVLPCKLGDTVYLPQKNDWGDLLSFEVIEIGVDRDGPFFVIDDEEHDHIPMSDIGANVFLTREEAEATLERGETSDDDNL